MKVLVTGSTGFVGHALCGIMQTRGFDVIAAVRNTKTRPLYNELVVGNIDDKTDWSGKLHGVDAIVHLAARVHMMNDKTSNPLEEFRRINYHGTVNLGKAAVQEGVKRFVYISSIKVNGEENTEPYTEQSQPAPNDPYGVSKLEAEQALKRLAENEDMEVVIIRPPLIYGPNVKANFLNLLKLIDLGLPLPFANINNKRSIIYIANFVDLIMLTITHAKAANEIFLVSDGRDISTLELMKLICNAMGRKNKFIHVPFALLNIAARIINRSSELKRLTGSLQISSDKVREQLDWCPNYTIQTGIQETVNWYKESL